MRIDWFTFGAQVINFLVLVWLLRRFLYRPILDAIDARESRIAARVADAEARETEAQLERETFRRRNEEFDHLRAERLAQTGDEVKAERQRLMDAARQAANDLAAQRKAALERERQDLDGHITRLAGAEVFAIARQVLTDLAGASLEERMTAAFIAHLRGMGADAKRQFAEALQAAAGAVVLRSAFDLPESQRSLIRTALVGEFGKDVPLAFETASDLVSGIELSAGGQKVSWTIAGYLVSMERQFGAILSVPVRSGSKAP